MGKIRILHCPEMVGGNAQQLARAEREIGLASFAVAFRPSPFKYKADEIVWAQGENPLIREFKRWLLFLRALKEFDIIHFNFGQSLICHWIAGNQITFNRSPLRKAYALYSRLFDLRDLPLLKLAGKGIVVTYQGDDARQGDFCLANFQINPAKDVEPGYYSPNFDAFKRFCIKKFSKYADRIYALNPDLLWVLPSKAQFLPYTHIDLRDWQFKNSEILKSKIPLILHAPSHRGVKGTKYILDAISRLKKEDIALEFKIVEGMTHIEARRVYEQADLLIDQLLCGWYGGIAVELMALGKPVICYIREGDLKFIPETMRKDLPIIHATPATIYEVLKEWITVRRKELPEIGQRSRAYVEKWHDPLKIAVKLKNDYEAIMNAKRTMGQL